MEVFKKHGTKERLFEMMKNVNKRLLKEDFDYHGAEMNHLGQQDLDAHQQEELSKELATLLKNSPDQFKERISTLENIPAYVHTGGMSDGAGNPLALGFRDLEAAGLANVGMDMPLDSNGEIETGSAVSTSDIPIYGIDTQKIYQKGQTLN
jgi:hypothetical protein